MPAIPLDPWPNRTALLEGRDVTPPWEQWYTALVRETRRVQFADTLNSSWVNAQDKGARPGTDSTAAILEARDALARTRGGRLILPASTSPYLISSRIDLTTQNIILTGDGANTYGNQITGLPASSLQWTGAAGGTMVYLGAVAGANNPTLRGAGIENVFFDCNSLANTAVEVRSLQNGWLRHLAITNALDAALYFSVIPYAAGVGVGQGLADQRNTCNCEFSDIWINSFGSDGRGLVLDGDDWTGRAIDVFSTADTCLNIFRNLHIFTNTQECFYVACADSNYICNSQFHRGDGGMAVILDLPYGIGNSYEVGREVTFRAKVKKHETHERFGKSTVVTYLEEV